MPDKNGLVIAVLLTIATVVLGVAIALVVRHVPEGTNHVTDGGTGGTHGGDDGKVDALLLAEPTIVRIFGDKAEYDIDVVMTQRKKVARVEPYAPQFLQSRQTAAPSLSLTGIIAALIRGQHGSVRTHTVEAYAPGIVANSGFVVITGRYIGSVEPRTYVFCLGTDPQQVVNVLVHPKNAADPDGEVHLKGRGYIIISGDGVKFDQGDDFQKVVDADADLHDDLKNLKDTADRAKVPFEWTP